MRKPAHLHICLLMAVLMLSLGSTPAAASPEGRILYVKPLAAGLQDCTTWDNACELQAALGGAAAGDQVWVAEGVHYPGPTGSPPTVTFRLKDAVSLYGGFAGKEHSRDQRDWLDHPAILSGDIDRNDQTQDGVVTDPANIQGTNAYHVVTGWEVSKITRLDGFTITAGSATSLEPDSVDARGGGMFNWAYSKPTLVNIIFSGNQAGSGGGLYVGWESHPVLTHVTFTANAAADGGGMTVDGGWSSTLTDVTFSKNNATNRGGGMFTWKASSLLTDVTFSENSATGGGGMASDDSNPQLTRVTFSDNSALNGGGMSIDAYSPTLVDVSFIGNSAAYGGGLHNFDGYPTLRGVTFFANTATSNGGGFYNDGNAISSPTLTNVTFTFNSAGENGGGMFLRWNSSPTLTNVTFATNSAENGGGIYNFAHYSQTTVLTNCILWGNIGGDEIVNEEGNTNVTYSIVQGGYPGRGNLNEDPLLAGLGDNGGPTLTEALLAGSPAIDAGDKLNCPETDQRGVKRPLDGDQAGGFYCDMGAFEYLPFTMTYTQITRDDPDPSLAGRPFTVSFSVDSDVPPVGEVTVTVQGRPANCRTTLVDGAGSCELAIGSPGDYILEAAFDGASGFFNSSASEPHSVKATAVLYLPVLVR